MEDGGFLLDEESDSKRQYKLSLWWVNHRAGLIRLGIIFFVVFDAVLASWALWHLLDGFAISYGDEQLAVGKMVAYGQSDLNAYTRANAAQDLVVDSEKVISTGSGRYDIYASIENPNADWWAEFTYVFGSDFGNGVTQRGFILPGEAKPLMELAREEDVPISSVEVELTDVLWHRVDHHVVGDYQLWADARLDLRIEDAEFTKQTNFDDEIFGRTTFTVVNDSAYSYFDPVMYVILKKSSSVVGIHRTTFKELNSGQRQEVVLNWFGTLPSAGTVEVIPELQLFDLSTYKALEGESTRDTRTRVF